VELVYIPVSYLERRKKYQSSVIGNKENFIIALYAMKRGTIILALKVPECFMIWKHLYCVQQTCFCDLLNEKIFFNIT